MKKKFKPSDDALIRQQPMTGVGIGRLAQILRTNHGSAIDTRRLRCTDGFVDPLLRKLKDVHGK
jgi:hypothetical protein